MSFPAWPDQPVLVEVWRSGFLESVHRGALVVVGADGAVLHAAGSVDRPILPRSSNKPVQATALVAAGWTPRSTEELAIGAGSDNGEDGHRDLLAGMLAAPGAGPAAPVASPPRSAAPTTWPPRRPCPSTRRRRPFGSSTGAPRSGWP